MADGDVWLPYDPAIFARMQKIEDARRLTPRQRAEKAKLERALRQQEAANIVVMRLSDRLYRVPGTEHQKPTQQAARADRPAAGKAFLAVGGMLPPNLQQRLRELTETLQTIGRDWTAETGQPIPTSIEEWERLAVRAGVPAGKLWDGDWTAAKLAPFILGYLDRLRDRVVLTPPKDQVGSAKLSSPELAQKHCVDAGALRKRLDRWRYEHDAGYVEVSNAPPREPKYLYDESAVMPIIEALRAKPAGQKRASNGHRKKR